MMTRKFMFSLRSAWLAGVCCSALLAGCLPELDEPPLTATGEAPEDEAPSGTGPGGTGAPAATTCTGVYQGNLPGGTKFAGQIPCTINGSVDMGALTADERQQITGVKNIQGTLYIATPAHITQLPALTSVYALTVNSFSGPTLDFPSRITVQHTVTISGGSITALKGFGGVKTLAAALTLQSLGNLQSIDAFPALEAVKTLTVNDLPALTSFKAFAALKSANVLNINNCQALAALPTFGKLASAASLQLGYMASMTTLASFPVLVSANSLSLTSLDGVSTVAFPVLASVSSFNVSGMAKLAELEGFGAQLKITGSIQVCNILMKGADREVWKQKHAPGLNFSNCGNGCFGWGTC